MDRDSAVVEHVYTCKKAAAAAAAAGGSLHPPVKNFPPASLAARPLEALACDALQSHRSRQLAHPGEPAAGNVCTRLILGRCS